MSAPRHSFSLPGLNTDSSQDQGNGAVFKLGGAPVGHAGLNAEQIESRVAARLAGALSVHHASFPGDISERLRVSREQAAARARQLRLAAASQAKAGSATVVVGARSAGAVLLGQGIPWWQRAAAALPLVALVAGLVLIEQRGQHEQVQAAALIDAQLLADDLPPTAYSDPGFAEFLRSTAYSPVSSVNAQVGE